MKNGAPFVGTAPISIKLRSNSALDGIPPEIVAAYYPKPGATCHPLGDGIINQTYLVTEVGGRQTVLQRLSTIFDERLIADFVAISTHLASDGWEVSELIKTVAGSLCHTDRQGRLWRAMSFIVSDGIDNEQADSAAIGALLGRLHGSLKKFDYIPQFAIPHYYDTPYFAARLAEVAGQLTSPELRSMAADITQAYAALVPPKTLSPQLLHGDPKLTNTLFRDGQPFTYIDFDTLLRGQVWSDLGNLLRSLASQAVAKDEPIDRTELSTVITGYRETAYADQVPEAFEKWGIAALQQMALELGMRYLIDIVEDYYFEWQGKGFADRAEHNAYKAGLQWRIFEAFKS
jgi:Ser/Thr protein kinase RdoA (MazF antagonist)